MLMPIQIPRFLDIEASSLSDSSYPIEIAWSDEKGDIESHLINPYAIEEWTDWDFYAEHKIHGLSRFMCRELGIHPEKMCDLMSQSIKAREPIYADGGEFDANWIDVLYGAGSTLGYAQFIVIHSDTVMLPLLMQVEPDEDKRLKLYERLKMKARKIVKAQHRAKVDVQYLIELWKLCFYLSRSGV